MRHPSFTRVLVLVLPLTLACGDGTGGGNNGGDGGNNGGGDGGNACGRRCQVNRNCPMGSPTTLTGVVTIPSGNLPLYNAKVYIPNGEVPPPPPTGASCDRCDSIVPADAVASAVTDINGRFTLANVPTGSDIPLIIRVGKWRRVVNIPAIADCATTPLDAGMTRLPRVQSEGNIPRIALSTGDADALECLLRGQKLGLDDSEFTNPTGSGRVNLFSADQGTNRYTDTLNGGATFPGATTWWNDNNANPFLPYDIVLFSCEGAQNAGGKSARAHQSLREFLDRGGRAFASHWHNVWISDGGAPIDTVADFVTNGGYLNDSSTIIGTVNLSFEKGRALADWMQLPAVKGMEMYGRGELPIRYSRQTLTRRDPMLTQDWVSFDPPGNYPLESQYFSFNAPVGAEPTQQCGQMVFTDIHVSGAPASPTTDASSTNLRFPTGCRSSGLTPQEKALIFMLFDLTNCLEPPIP